MDAQENELPALAGIAGIIHWFEELLNIINGPVLMFGAGIALVDLLTDGALTATTPALLIAWAVSQAIGIDTQVLASFARAKHARGWSLAGWLILGAILGYAVWQAGYVFAVQQSQHISEGAAVAQLGMSPAVWLGWRSFLAVGLVALSGWTRYRKPAKVKVSLEDEQAAIERELTLEPLRQQLRARQVGGLRGLAEAALHGAPESPVAPLPAPAIPEPVAEVAPDVTPDGPPDGPGGGVTQDVTHETDKRRSDGHSPRRTGQLTPFTRSRNPRRLSPTAEAARQRRAYAYLEADAGLSKAGLRRKLRCQKAASDVYWTEWHNAHTAQQAG